MQDIKDLYILGKPIETKLGNLRFIKVKEYDEFIKHIPYILLDKNEVIKGINKEYQHYFVDRPFIEIIKYFNENPYNLYKGYKELFQFCFSNDVFDLIQSDEEFNYYIDLIKKMNYLHYAKPNPNPEIEKFNRFKKYLQKKKGEEITFESVYTSVGLFMGCDPDEMSIYKMYAYFNRIGQFKNHETTTLYSTVAKDVKIELWCKHIDMFNIETKKTSLEEFSQHAKNMMK